MERKTATELSARDTILQATEGLLQHQSLDDLSVAQILEAAGLSRATFYVYFGSKDEAFLGLLAELIDDVVPAFETTLGSAVVRQDPARLGALIRDWLTSDGPRRAVLVNAIQEWPRRPDIRALYLDGMERLELALTPAIAAGRTAGPPREGVDAPQVAAGLAWAMECVWLSAATGEHGMRLDAAADALADIVIAAVHGPDHRPSATAHPSGPRPPFLALRQQGDIEA